jgi:20S proteasome alpha/beta subunit
MTLIVALTAADGVVLVSDGQATVLDNAVRTRSDADKLDDIQGLVAFGCSGMSGLQQRVAGALKRGITADQCRLPIEELRPRLFELVNGVQREALAEHVPVHQDALPAHLEVLFAGYSDGMPWVYEVDLLGHDEVHPHGEAIGHARHFPAYLMMSTLHYNLQARGVEQVKILAYRAVADAIKTDATTLGPPIRGYVVTATGAERLSEARLKSIEDTLNAWKQQEHDIFRELERDLSSPAPSPAPAATSGIEV